MPLKQFLRQLIIPIEELDRVLPKQGLIYEIGAGYGIISAELAQLGKKRKVVSIDLDTEKIEKMRSQWKYSNLEAVTADAGTFPYKRCVGAVLSDFLHHVPYKQQEKILKKITEKLSGSGVLIIREIDNDDFPRQYMSRVWDFLFYPRDKIYYRSKTHWLGLLSQLDYTVKVKRIVSWFPGSAFLFICTKQ